MYVVACDVSRRTFRDVLGGQLRTWLRRRARSDGRPGNETPVSDDTPLVDAPHIRAPDGLPTTTTTTTTTNAAGKPEVNATAPSASTSNTVNQSPSITTSGVVPAVIAVVIFVVCVFAILRILRAIRLNHVVAAYTAEPQTPRMWEVCLDKTTAPSFEGKWNEIMPLAAHRTTQCDTGSRFPLTRGVSVSVDISDSQTSRRGSGDSNNRLLPLTFKKNTVGGLEEDCMLPGHVAVLIAMPIPDKHTSAHVEQSSVVGPICIGVVDM